MSNKPMESIFTERHEDGDFTIEIVSYVTRNHISICFSSPEHEAQFSFDNFWERDGVEARLHPKLIAEFIEKTIGDGEVKCHFERRSDELAKELDRLKSRTKDHS